MMKHMKHPVEPLSVGSALVFCDSLWSKLHFYQITNIYFKLYSLIVFDVAS